VRPQTGQPPDVSEPTTGAALAASGGLVVLGGVLPWARIPVLDLSLTGLHLGSFATVCGVVMAAAGIMIVLRYGRAWVSVATLIMGVYALVVALLVAGSIQADQATEHHVEISEVSASYGLWTTIAGIAAAMVSAVYALCRRTARPAGYRLTARGNRATR
jgi:hypothetical protein